MAVVPDPKSALRSIEYLVTTAGELIEDARGIALDDSLMEVEATIQALSTVVSDTLRHVRAQLQPLVDDPANDNG